ncbi:MAG: outer membrane lipid asymmetry maintenance protein MlaD [Candidatus Magnetoovum sp. WYHC-5]|nr:outer membrane lipid asymmetry maintenance protein MlaD [Candidatus Magnetoovum sp. WYHC-5]
MNSKYGIEVAVGSFLSICFACVIYLSIQLGNFQLMNGSGYKVNANFAETGGLKKGATVEIAGVEIGRVKDIKLDDKTYMAIVYMLIKDEIKIQEDSIASIKTKGLLGDKYVQIAPGGSENILKEGENIKETESAINLEDMLSKYAFGGVK